MMRRYTAALLLFFLILPVRAQQQPAWTQYMLNRFSINPAVAGSSDDFQIAANYRKLWAGVKEAPSSQYLSGQLKVADKMGAGLTIFNRTSGIVSRTGFGATYAYHVPLKEEGQYLAFGLTGMLYQLKYDVEGDNLLEDPDDPFITLGAYNMMVPDASFGVYYYSDKYYIGYSVAQLFQWKTSPFKNSDADQREVRHHYLIGGYHYDVNPDFSIDPTAMLKLLESGIVQADVSLIATFKNMFWAGALFRPTTAVSVLLGINYDPISFGYSYDMNLSDIKANSFGSHELLLIYRMKNFMMK